MRRWEIADRRRQPRRIALNPPWSAVHAPPCKTQHAHSWSLLPRLRSLLVDLDFGPGTSSLARIFLCSRRYTSTRTRTSAGPSTSVFPRHRWASLGNQNSREWPGTREKTTKREHEEEQRRSFLTPRPPRGSKRGCVESDLFYLEVPPPEGSRKEGWRTGRMEGRVPVVD